MTFTKSEIKSQLQQTIESIDTVLSCCDAYYKQSCDECPLLLTSDPCGIDELSLIAAKDEAERLLERLN